MFRLCISRIVKPEALSVSICSRYVATSSGKISAVNQEFKKSMSLFNNNNASPQLSRVSPIVQTVRYNSSLPSESIEPELKSARQIVNHIEKAFARYEAICHNTERTNEANFARTFNIFTQCVDRLKAGDLMNDNVKTNLSLMASILLRSCGNLMVDTPEKGRELLAGNVWQYMKENGIPADISHYNILIRVLNENNTDFDPQKILSEITEASLTPDRVTYQRLIHRYCLQGDVNGATTLLDKMKELNFELTEGLFASLLLGYSKQENPPTVAEMFELMKSNGVEPAAKTYAAAIISRAQLLGTKPEQIDELKNVLTLLETNDVIFSTTEIEEIITTLAPLKNDEVIQKIYDRVMECARKSLATEYRTISALMKAGDYEGASMRFWQARNNSRNRNNNTSTNYIRLLTVHSEVPTEHVIDECFKMVESNLNDKAFFSLYYYATQNKKYELIRASLDQIKGTADFRCQYCWPLLAQTKDLDKVIEVLKNDLNPGMSRSDLVDTFVDWVWPHFSGDFRKLFEINNQELHYDSNLLIYSLIRYGAKEQKIDAVTKFITDDLPSLVKIEDDAAGGGTSESSETQEASDESEEQSRGRTHRTRSRDLSVGIGRFLLTQIADQNKDPETVEKVFNALTASKTAGVSNLGLTALVRAHILKGDYETALTKFKELAREYRATPCKADLMAYCLDNKNAESLQEIMNISTEIHGEQNSLYDLAVCCLRGGHLKQAQKIFATGLRVQPYRVFDTCQILAKYEKIDVLENFVEFSSTMPDIDKESLYMHLINCYRQSDPQKLLDLWNKMQDEQFAPSKKIMTRIANILEANNIPVPFTKPVNVK